MYIGALSNPLAGSFAASSAESRGPLRGILNYVPLKVREVIRLLERHSWLHVRTTGDHRIYRHSDGRVTVVSGRLGDDVRPGTWRAILKQTGIEEPG